MTAGETAEYVQTHLIELEKLCRASGLDVVAFIIGLAIAEAESNLVLQTRRK